MNFQLANFLGTTLYYIHERCLQAAVEENEETLNIGIVVIRGLQILCAILGNVV